MGLNQHYYKCIGIEKLLYNYLYADMAELVDAQDSGSCDRKIMQVRFLLSAPKRLSMVCGTAIPGTVKTRNGKTERSRPGTARPGTAIPGTVNTRNGKTERSRPFPTIVGLDKSLGSKRIHGTKRNMKNWLCFV